MTGTLTMINRQQNKGPRECYQISQVKQLPPITNNPFCHSACDTDTAHNWSYTVPTLSTTDDLSVEHETI